MNSTFQPAIDAKVSQMRNDDCLLKCDAFNTKTDDLCMNDGLCCNMMEFLKSNAKNE